MAVVEKDRVLDSGGQYVSVYPGTVIFFASAFAPSGYLQCNGAAISRTTYSFLYQNIGDYFGGGNGFSTFNIPDLRGEFIRGWDAGRGVDPGRGFASWQRGTLVAGYDDNSDAADISFVQNRAFNDFGSDPVNSDIAWGVYGLNGVVYQPGSPIYQDYVNVYRWYSITRPRNFALMACIKY